MLIFLKILYTFIDKVFSFCYYLLVRNVKVYQGGYEMEALQKVIDAFKTIFGYLEVFIAEIKASLGLGE